MRVPLIAALLAVAPVAGCSGCNDPPPTTTVPPDDSLRAAPAPSKLPSIVGLGEGGLPVQDLFDVPFDVPRDFVIDVSCVTCPANKTTHITADGTATSGAVKTSLNQNAVGRIVAKISRHEFFLLPDELGKGDPTMMVSVTMNGQKKTVRLHLKDFPVDAGLPESDPRWRFLEVANEVHFQLYNVRDH